MTSIIFIQFNSVFVEVVIGRKEIARLTQKIDQIRVCELDAGSPRYHVPAFQIIAVMRSERTTKTQKLFVCSEITSRGRR